MDGILAKLIEAAKGSIDLLAFISSGLIAALVFVNTKDLVAAVVFAAVLAVLWVGLRYALLKIHAKERLQAIRENAKLRALEVLAKYADKDDVESLIKLLTSDGET